MLCRRRFGSQELLRLSRDREGTLRFGERGGRGVWMCGGSHRNDIRAAIRQGLRGPVSDKEFDVIEEAHRAWVESSNERRGA